MLRRTFSPSFTVAAALLLISAAGLHSIVEAMELFFVKQPVPLRQKLYRMPKAFGPYVMVGKDVPLPPAVADELGTDDHLTRVYRNMDLDEQDPTAYIRLHLAYYTGTPDGVPHIPERCYVARGARGFNVRADRLDLRGDHIHTDTDGQVWAQPIVGAAVRLPDDRMNMSVFEFLPHNSDVPAAVSYFFVVNGNFVARPRSVRASILDLRSKYAYFCKVEVMPAAPINQPETARRIIEPFLAHALPELFVCLPDWHEVLDGQWPTKDD